MFRPLSPPRCLTLQEADSDAEVMQVSKGVN